MEKVISVTGLELQRVDWGNLREIRSGLTNPIISASYIPSVINDMLNAKKSAEVDELYWKVENNIFVQGQLFEAAEYLVPVLIASLFEVQNEFVKTAFLELLLQIVSGEASQSEMNLGNSNLGEKCRAKAREGLWILYNELINGDSNHSESALEILEKIETDSSRLGFFLKARQ